MNSATSSLISIDYTLMMAENVAGSGVTQAALTTLLPRVESAITRVHERHQSGELGFPDLPDDAGLIEQIERYIGEIGGAVDTMLVLGIGGSSLGPRALTDALAHLPTGKKVHYVDNADPDTLNKALSGLDPQRTLVNVVSKSGGTVETLAAYLITRTWLEDHLTTDETKKRLVFTTDDEQGFLRRIATDEGIHAFSIPSNVGGRFSVLSSVGLLPATFAGIDTRALLKGARTMRESCISKDVLQNPAALSAAIHFLMDLEHHRPNTIFWVYADALRSTAGWFAQLWGESLGKRKGGKGVGPTPIPAVGATDQHSQLQLYMEGPPNKHIWFVELEEFDHPGALPALHPAAPEIEYLEGTTLQALIHAERRATALALGRAGTPNATIRLARRSPECVGALLFLLETQTAIAGELYGINAFDQPGVEAGKLLTYGIMGRAGYEQYRTDLEEFEKHQTPHVLSVFDIP